MMIAIMIGADEGDDACGGVGDYDGDDGDLGDDDGDDIFLVEG